MLLKGRGLKGGGGGDDHTLAIYYRLIETDNLYFRSVRKTRLKIRGKKGVAVFQLKREQVSFVFQHRERVLLLSRAIGRLMPAGMLFSATFHLFIRAARVVPRHDGIDYADSRNSELLLFYRFIFLPSLLSALDYPSGFLRVVPTPPNYADPTDHTENPAPSA